MNKIILTIIMLVLCLPVAFATVTNTINAPSNLAITNTTSMLFNWTPVVTGATATGLTSWLRLSPVNNKTLVVNQTVTVTNNTWRNVTISNLAIGMYKWDIVTNSSLGNSTTAYRWFEIRDSNNQSLFRWENETGFRLMSLDITLGNLNISGTFSGTLIWSNLSSYPVACPGGSYITELGDSTTCTQINSINGSLSVPGTLNLTGVNSTIWFANNASIITNTTCLILRSPDGSGVTNVCNA